MASLRRNIVLPYPAQASEAAAWIWAIEDTRARTLRTLAEVTQRELDATVESNDSISTQLYHLALIEADYLCMDVMGRSEYLPDLAQVLPFPVRDSAGRLTVITGETLRQHLERLAVVRRSLIAVFARMSSGQFRARRALPEWGYEISPEWALHHLMQHEAEHRGDIAFSLNLIRSPQ
jgi:uncharacterized damage-inducible protein DinB